MHICTAFFILLLLLIVSICINIYQFSRVPDYVPTDDVNYVSFQKESNNVDAPQQVKNDDDGLDYKFEKKKNEQLRDSISLLLKKLETADNNQNGKNPKVLKRIINNLKKEARQKKQYKTIQIAETTEERST